VGGNELPTSFTDKNTYQKIQRRRRTTTTITITATGEVRFVHSFKRENEREWVRTNCRLVLPILICFKSDEEEEQQHQHPQEK